MKLMYMNPAHLHNQDDLMRTLANIEDPDKMSHSVCFHDTMVSEVHLSIYGRRKKQATF